MQWDLLYLLPGRHVCPCYDFIFNLRVLCVCTLSRDKSILLFNWTASESWCFFRNSRAFKNSTCSSQHFHKLVVPKNCPSLEWEHSLACYWRESHLSHTRSGFQMKFPSQNYFQDSVLPSVPLLFLVEQLPWWFHMTAKAVQVLSYILSRSLWLCCVWSIAHV